jgi:hypothetical protein
MKPVVWFAGSAMVLLMATDFTVTRAKEPGTNPPGRAAAGKGAPPSTEFDYPHADLRGSLVLQAGCEETPTLVSLDITSVTTRSGEDANFPIMLNGLADWEVVPPLPDYLLGTYMVGSLVASSANFLYGSPRPSRMVSVVELGQVYTLSVEVVPTTARMEGTVVNQDGEPQDGALVQLSGPDEITYEGRTRGGAYAIELIGMGDARRNAEADLPVLVVAPGAKGKCDETRTTVHLKAGVTEHRNFVIKAQGALSGDVLDSEGAPVAGARISLSYPKGKRFTAVASQAGVYQLEDIPEGPATAIATCPDGKKDRSQEVEIKCEQRSYQRANFTLQCGCKVAGFITRPNGEPVEQARVTLRPIGGKTVAVTSSASGRYVFNNVAKGKATITATCPQGSPSRSVSLEITCPEEGQEAPLTLECGRAADFHLVHTGTVVGDCSFTRTEAKASGEALFSFPKGADTVEFQVPYTVVFRVQGKTGPGGTMAISPSAFTLRAQVRWTVHRERLAGRDCLRVELETVEQGEQSLHIKVTNESGDVIADYDVPQPAIAGPGWILGSGRCNSCESAGIDGLRLEVHMDRRLAPLCVAPATVAALVTGESRVTEHVTITPLRPAQSPGNAKEQP